MSAEHSITQHEPTDPLARRYGWCGVYWSALASYFNVTNLVTLRRNKQTTNKLFCRCIANLFTTKRSIQNFSKSVFYILACGIYTVFHEDYDTHWYLIILSSQLLNIVVFQGRLLLALFEEGYGKISNVFLTTSQ